MKIDSWACPAFVVAAFFLAVVPTPSTFAQDADRAQEADTVYTNAKIWTGDVLRSRAEAVAIREGKFIRVGTNDEIKAVRGPDTKVVDVQGKMIMPGIIDSHIHAVRGGLGHLFFCQFPVTATVEDIQNKIKECASKADKESWIEGKTWDSSLAKKVTAKMLDDASPDHPVYLHDDTNHLGWLNSAALKAAKIDKDIADPPGGSINRDDSGAPTGVIHDAAASLVIKAMPPVPVDHIRKAAEWIFAKLNSYGVTAVTLAQLDAGRLEAYRAMEKDGALTLRLQGSWDFNTRYATLPIDQMTKVFATREKRGEITDLINPDGVKIYADGVWLGYGSPFIDMYETGETYGRQSIDQPTLSTWVTRFDKEGLKVMIHAVGDQAVRNSLNAIEAARRANGDLGPRHHVGHNTFVHAEDMARAKDLNVVLEVSPANTWYPSSYTPSFVELLGAERVRNMVPIGELRRKGGVVAYGSDWDNVPEPDPWIALQTQLTRRNPEAPELGVLGPDQRVDLETAMEIITINGAHTMELEDETGSIEVGKDADFIVLNQDLFEIPVEDIHKTKVLQTVLRGRTVYRSD